jgi:hypothetical protein
MTLPLREYLAQRRADIQANIKAFRKELAEIDAAERALEEAADPETRARKERGTQGSGRKTLKELAIGILADHPEGLEASAILQELERRHGLTVRRESLSPQLSRLGHDKTLTRDGLTWKLFTGQWIGPHSSPNDETPGVSPPDASSLRGDLEDGVDL